LTVALELGSTEAIKEALFERLGVAVLSRRAVAKELTARRLKPVHVEGLTLDRDMYVVRDRRRILPSVAQLFLAFVRPEPDNAASAQAAP
jgi:DNA-binding transcriptional LysR family regulator